MTAPQPPQGREPLSVPQLRDKAREILTDLIAGGGSPSAASREGSGGRRRRVVILAAILGALLAGAVWKTGLLSPGREIADGLVGVWTTTAPAYADRTFEITKTLITFDSGGQRYSVNSIRKVAVVQDPVGALYTIDYTTPDDQVAELSFWYVQGREDMIRFKNQQHLVWTKLKP